MSHNLIFKKLTYLCFLTTSWHQLYAKTLNINTIFEKIENGQINPVPELSNIEPWYELLEFRYDFDTLFEKREITLRVKPNSIAEINYKKNIRNIERQKFKINKKISVRRLKQAVLKLVLAINEIDDQTPLLKKKLELLRRKEKILRSNIVNVSDNAQEIFSVQKKVKLIEIDITNKKNNLTRFLDAMSKYTAGLSGDVKFSGFDSFEGMLRYLKSSKKNNTPIMHELIEAEHKLNLQKLNYQNALVSDFLTFLEVSKEMGDSDLTQLKFGFKIPFGISNSNSQAFNAAYAFEKTRIELEASEITSRQISINRHHDLVSKIDYYRFLSESDYAKNIKKQISTPRQVNYNDLQKSTELELVNIERLIEMVVLKNQIIFDYYSLVFSENTDTEGD